MFTPFIHNRDKQHMKMLFTFEIEIADITSIEHASAEYKSICETYFKHADEIETEVLIVDDAADGDDAEGVRYVYNAETHQLEVA